MSQQPANASALRLIQLFNGAYWIALLIIAAMAMASFILLQQMMAAQQHDQALLALTGTQKALSQRVVFLANAANTAPRNEQPALVGIRGDALAKGCVAVERGAGDGLVEPRPLPAGHVAGAGRADAELRFERGNEAPAIRRQAR